MSNSHALKQKEDQVYRLGNLELLEEQILCRWFGQNIELTKTEFALLRQLVKRPRVVYTRDQLLDVCYSHDIAVTDRNIDSHIKRLRKKFRHARPDIDFNRIKTS